MKMKILVENYNFEHSSVVVSYNNKKFKIVARNGNSYSVVTRSGGSYSELRIYLLTDSGFSLIADEYDIPNYSKVNYFDTNEERYIGSFHNIEEAKRYITNVF